jgi:hypothetical protein
MTLLEELKLISQSEKDAIIKSGKLTGKALYNAGKLTGQGLIKTGKFVKRKMNERKYNNEMKVLKKYGYDVPKS